MTDSLHKLPFISLLRSASGATEDEGRDDLRVVHFCAVDETELVPPGSFVSIRVHSRSENSEAMTQNPDKWGGTV